MKKIMILTLAGLSLLISSCESNKKYDGLVIQDCKSGKTFILEHRLGVTYAIKEQIKVINNKDTTTVVVYNYSSKYGK